MSPDISVYEAENLLKKTTSKIYWKKLDRLFIESLMKIYSSDHTTSYLRWLEPHNLELFRIDVTNCLEIFCENRSSMFSVLNISFHESGLSSPAFLPTSQHRVSLLDGELCVVAEILDLKAAKLLLSYFSKEFTFLWIDDPAWGPESLGYLLHLLNRDKMMKERMMS